MSISEFIILLIIGIVGCCVIFLVMVAVIIVLFDHVLPKYDNWRDRREAQRRAHRIISLIGIFVKEDAEEDVLLAKRKRVLENSSKLADAKQKSNMLN